MLSVALEVDLDEKKEEKEGGRGRRERRGGEKREPK